MIRPYSNFQAGGRANPSPWELKRPAPRRVSRCRLFPLPYRKSDTGIDWDYVGGSVSFLAMMLLIGFAEGIVDWVVR